jgi:hypothetical protein
VAKELRNMMLRSRTPDEAMAGMDWLYSKQPELMPVGGAPAAMAS